MKKRKLTHNFLSGINRKEPVAYKELYVCYYKSLCVYSASISGDSFAAEDIVQDLLLKIWQSDCRFDTIPEFSLYLYKSVYHNTIAYVRDRCNRSFLLKNMLTEKESVSSMFEGSVEEDMEWITEIVGDEIIRCLYNGISRLSVSQQKVIQLSMDGLKNDEIAKCLNISINTVKTLKYRGYKTLKLQLKK